MENNFFDSYHCKSKFHCKTCRDIEDDGFRVQLHDSFSDIHEINFDCPHGVPWGAKGEIMEASKDKYDDRNIVNVDMVKSSRELFEKVEKLQPIIDEYGGKVADSKCSPCLRARINRAINRVLVSHIQENKDINLLNSLNQDLILADGETDKQVSEWKSEIQNVL